MALFKEWNIGTHGLAAIWKIDEDESFFAGHTGLVPDIKNDLRRIEHLAGRFLLRFLEKDFPLHDIFKDEHNKPRLDNGKYFFSVSHSWPYVAAVIDPFCEAGIDIQTWHERILLIQNKFLSPVEQQFFHNDPKLVTLAWCAKESVYKFHGKKGVDFIRHLPISAFLEHHPGCPFTIDLSVAQPTWPVHLCSMIHTDFACAYVSGSGKATPVLT